MSFQQQVNMHQAPAVEGDFASVNPYASVIALDAAVVAADEGVTVGRFAWVVGNEASNAASNAGTTAPTGFVSRRGNHAVITQWLGRYSMIVPKGVNVTLHVQGEFFAKTSAAATIGQKIFASTTDGSVTTGTAGTNVPGFVETNYYAATAANAGELVAISTWVV